MKKGTLTREEAIEIVGVDAVDAVDGISCEPTNRVGYNGSCQGDEETEYACSVEAKDKDGNDVHLIAYYYQDADTEDEENDLDALVWNIEGYEVV